ncbi:LysR substrate-binding domain-containing protein [Paenacidovorax monticola]|uniref:LysR family transcriptional regulator n=1 Tax=Paenacidovorax monticola TaxID=1926868 RepID=A0A7H0HCS6_9BURK|nr:LysR substrate-binding domain-containing protein [Paenacidovorax monticola]QNP58342.1 LysR family transcriptional regulator [Paenacidovorax monticola]
MKLHLLRYFAVLAEELHFGRAAERLAITQPPLSSGIKALEEELGVRLFERSSKHVELTPAGHAYLAEVRIVLDRVARAGETARAVAAGLQGRLDIGFTGSMVYRDMPRIVRAFGARAPGIEVQLREMSSSEQIEALLHRQLHAGFVNTSTVPPRLACLPLAADHFVCCLPEDHALAHERSVPLTALAQETFVMFARDVAPANHDNVIALFHRAGIHPHTRHAARQWLTVVSLVALRMGVALVPASLAQAGVQGVRFVPIAGLHHPTVGVLAWHEETDTPALRVFLACAAGA